MTSITSWCEIFCQFVQKKQEEKQIEEEQAAKAQTWKLFYDDDDEESSNSLNDNISELPPYSAITPDEPVLSTEEPDISLSMGDEHLDTIPATESDEFIKSGVENLIPIPSESEGILEHVCDVHSIDNSPPLDVSKDTIKDFSESNEEFSSTGDDSFSCDKIDYVEASPLDSEHVSSEVMEIVIQEVGGIKASNDNPIPSYDPIISGTPPNLTPSGESEFFSEVDAFLAVEDESTSSQFPNSYFDLEGDMLLFDAFLNDDHSFESQTKSSSTSLNSLLEETNNFHNSLPECTTFSHVLCDADCESDSSDDQSPSDKDVLEKIVSKPLSEEEIIPIESLRTHDSSLPISSKIDSLLEEFAGELTLLKSIPPGIDETDCDFEEDIRLIEKLLYDNSSPRPPEEFVFANSEAATESFSPSPIPIKDNDSLMEEIDLLCTPDYPMPPGSRKNICEAPTEGYEDAIVVLAITADNFELKHGLLTLVQNKQFYGHDKEDPHAYILYFNKITSTLKFPNFFPPSKTTSLRNEITNFQQLDESFSEAWDRFKDLLRACPHHGFSALHQFDTFYNALNSKDQDSLNSAAGDMVKALLLDKKGQNQSPAPVKAVEESCVTCGGGHSYRNCPATDGNIYSDNIQEFMSQASAVNYNQGNTSYHPQMMSNQIQPLGFPSAPAYQALAPQTQGVSKEDFLAYVKANDAVMKICKFKQLLRLVLQILTQNSIPYPSRRNNERNREKANSQIKKFYHIFKDMSFKISFADALILMLKFALTLKALIGNKEKLSEMAQTLLNEHCSAVLLKKLPEKLGDPGKFLIPCDFLCMAECLALADLGASINLMPFYVWKRLSLPDLTPTCMTLELADHSISRPVGIAEDVYVKVGLFHFPVDFVVVDFDADPQVPLILRRSFLKIERALIDVFEGELTLRVSKEAITFNLDQTLRYSANYSNMTAKRIDVIDMACEEYSQEVLGFSDTISSGSPTPYYDLIVSTTSLTLTPFRNSDFLLEENYLPEVRKELQICEAKSKKSSVDEPLVVELKALPPHLEYAFLEGDDKLPVIIAKDLSVEEKTALITDFTPAVQHQRRVNLKIHDVIKQEVIKLLDAGLIYPISDSPWVSPVRCVPKKGRFIVVENEDNELIPNGLVTGWRVCIDYRKLNEATRKDHFPLPFMNQMLERLAGNQYYCFLDGFSGYFQISIDPKDQEKTTFTCPYRMFAYRRMPFGLFNAPGMFRRCMMAIFHDMIEKTMEVFMDDFSVLGIRFKEGIVLGHKISKQGIEVDKAKVDVIPKLPHLTTLKGIRSFLGHTGFYRRFINDFSKIARPMTRLLEKDTPFNFSQECVDAFQTLKRKLTEAPILIAPDWDMPFELICDASDFAIGAEFTFKVVDTKGAENLAADHLSRLENPHQNVLDPKEINESFPLETLNLVSTRGNQSTPWFADFANYHAGNFIVKGMSS
nr:hypothetical protein [Tanacetum cinerariifolium]